MKASYTTKPFTVSFSPCTEDLLPWVWETRRAARLIAERATRPIYLCFSGGIDSEVMAEAFFTEKIPFKVLTFSYNGINDHDIGFAKTWCREKRVEQEIVPFDVQELFGAGTDRLANEGYVTGSAFRYLQISLLKAVEERNGFAVLGGGEQLYDIPQRPNLTIEDPFLTFDVGFVAPVNWCKTNQVDHEPYFFFSTPELMRSWMKIPHVEFALHHPEIFRHPINRNGLKILMIRMLFPKQAWRNKYNGFEKITHLRTDAERRLKLLFGDKLETYRLPVVDLIKMLEGRP